MAEIKKLGKDSSVFDQEARVWRDQFKFIQLNKLLESIALDRGRSTFMFALEIHEAISQIRPLEFDSPEAYRLFFVSLPNLILAQAEQLLFMKNRYEHNRESDRVVGFDLKEKEYLSLLEELDAILVLAKTYCAEIPRDLKEYERQKSATSQVRESQ